MTTNEIFLGKTVIIRDAKNFFFGRIAKVMDLMILKDHEGRSVATVHIAGASSGSFTATAVRLCDLEAA